MSNYIFILLKKSMFYAIKDELSQLKSSIFRLQDYDHIEMNSFKQMGAHFCCYIARQVFVLFSKYDRNDINVREELKAFFQHEFVY